MKEHWQQDVFDPYGIIRLEIHWLYPYSDDAFPYLFLRTWSEIASIMRVGDVRTELQLTGAGRLPYNIHPVQIGTT